MAHFAERLGYKNPAAELDEREVPASLRNGLWDVFTRSAVGDLSEIIAGYIRTSRRFTSVLERIWFGFFRESIDSIPSEWFVAYRLLKEKFYSLNFPEFYDFVEFIAPMAPIGVVKDDRIGYVKRCNSVFERERCAFRFAGSQLVRIHEPDELQEVELAFNDNPSQAVRNHLRAAAKLYGDRRAPDFRNSIKESISAVEAAVSFALGKKANGLSDPLQAMVKDLNLHPALAQGFIKLYAYTSDADGIRHALMGESDLTQEDARYMLVSCSAFSNYLISLKARQQN